MTSISILAEKRHFCYLVVVSTALLGGAWSFGRMFADSPAYLDVARFFLRPDLGELAVQSQRLLQIRPVVPFLASLLAALTGVETGFSVVSLAFWIGSSVLIFELVGLATSSLSSRLLASLLFNFSLPALWVGAGVILEMPTWFFLVLGLYLQLRWRDDVSFAMGLIAGIIVGVGVLVKETVLILVLSQLLMAVLAKDRRIRRLGHLGVFLVGVALPVVLWNAFLGTSLVNYYYLLVGNTVWLYSPEGWSSLAQERWMTTFLVFDIPELPPFLIVSLRWIASLGMAFHVAVIPIASRLRDALGLTGALGLWPYVGASLVAILSRPYADLRLMFVLFPAVLTVTSIEISRLGRTAILVLGAYVILSIFGLLLSLNIAFA